ncbi:MAG: hypothetical protein EOM20_20775 [Spartobacteria bacterium]|nr:hypothetical protein [Spartobacteria bacterium]
MIDSAQQQLMAEILDLFAQRFDKHAVLRGGMVLRMLGCERLTNDLDYVFVPYASKKDIVDEALSALKSLPGVKLQHSLNSKCLRIVVRRGDVSVQVEAKTAMQVTTDTLSTAHVAKSFDLPPRLIRVVNYSCALADKLAAWNERRLARDLYDVWFFLRMGVLPDLETLTQRLREPVYSKLVKKKDQFVGDSVDAFYDFLITHVAAWSDDRFAEELEDYLPSSELAGISMRLRAELVKLQTKTGVG